MSRMSGVYSADELWDSVDRLIAQVESLEAELAKCQEVLSVLAEYTGGSGASPGHPAREAWDYLTSLPARES